MTIINYSFLLIISVAITGCSTSYSTSTNLDKSNFTDYFAPSYVTIYKSENDLPKSNQLIGIVEGQDCQAKPHLAAPDKINARTDARRKAHALSANAIVFSDCAIVEDPECSALLICYGKAYQVISDNTENDK